VAGTLDTDVRRPYDETDSHGPAYRSLLRQLEHTDLDGLAGRVQRRVNDRGCAFGGGDEEARFRVDPVPRVVGGREWDALTAGLVQRVTALERFVADVHGPREAVAAGVLPARVLDGCEHHEPRLRDLPVGTWITVAGLDLVRGADGELAVLEDNTRTPSGLAYLQAARDAVSRNVMIPGGRRLRTLDGLAPALGAALQAAAPEGIDEPEVALLTDGPANAAHWEHATLARRLRIALIELTDLETAGGRLWRRDDEGRRRPVDVLYRRTDEERLFDTAFETLLLGPLRAGRLAVANAFGTGVADDKLVHAYVEDLVRFHLDEEPLLKSVPTYDLGAPGVLEMVLDRLGELVVKPRAGHGGRGVVIGPHADATTLETTRRLVAASPDRYVAQEVVLLSEHPTVSGDELVLRHVDLRPFVLSAGERRRVMPGGLTRVALEEGELIVNSSRDGGAKDTWVLD
jgi:carboxylate-amine ligase